MLKLPNLTIRWAQIRDKAQAVVYYPTDLIFLFLNYCKISVQMLIFKPYDK